MGGVTVRRDFANLTFRKVALLLISIMALNVGVAVGQGKGLAIAKRRPHESMPEALQRAALERYLNGVYLKGEGRLLESLVQFDSALAYDPYSDVVRLEVVRVASALGDQERAKNEADNFGQFDVPILRVLVDLHRHDTTPDSVAYYLSLLADIDSTDVASRGWLNAYYERLSEPDSSRKYLAQLARIKDDGKSYTELGGAYSQAGDAEKAAEAYRQALERSSGEEKIAPYSGLSDALAQLGKSEERGEVLHELLEIDPDYVPTRRRLIEYYASSGFYDSALVHAKAEVELIPQDHDAIRRLGIVAYNADSLEVSKEQFNTLISIGDQNLTNYFFLGSIFLDEDNLPYAEVNFRQATRVAGEVIDGWMGLGRVYRRMDSLSAEERTYHEALARMPRERDSVGLYFSLGAVSEFGGADSASEDYFLRALELNPNHAPSLNYLGYMLADKNERISYALELLARALKVAPNSGAYLDSYGWALYRAGEYEAARDSLLRAAESMNPDPVIFEHIGDVFDKLNLPDSADTYWQKALEIDAGNTGLKEKLAR